MLSKTISSLSLTLLTLFVTGLMLFSFLFFIVRFSEQKKPKKLKKLQEISDLDEISINKEEFPDFLYVGNYLNKSIFLYTQLSEFETLDSLSTEEILKLRGVLSTWWSLLIESKITNNKEVASFLAFEPFFKFFFYKKTSLKVYTLILNSIKTEELKIQFSEWFIEFQKPFIYILNKNRPVTYFESGSGKLFFDKANLSLLIDLLFQIYQKNKSWDRFDTTSFKNSILEKALANGSYGYINSLLIPLEVCEQEDRFYVTVCNKTICLKPNSLFKKNFKKITEKTPNINFIVEGW